MTKAPATGYNILPFVDDSLKRAWLYTNSRGYAVGTTLMYRKSVWAARHFHAVHIGEDNQFIDALGGRLQSESGTQIVARMHPDSTVQKVEMLTGTKWSTGPRETWQEIDYQKLSGSGYPVL